MSKSLPESHLDVNNNQVQSAHDLSYTYQNKAEQELHKMKQNILLHVSSEPASRKLQQKTQEWS